MILSGLIFFFLASFFKFLEMFGNEMIGDQEKIYTNTINGLFTGMEDQKLQIQEQTCNNEY